MSDERTEGLLAKYDVQRRNDPDGKHDACRYFVLDPQHDPLARAALRAYALSARGEGYEALADDLREWLIDIEGATEWIWEGEQREALADALKDIKALTAAMGFGVPYEAWSERRQSIADSILASDWLAERVARAEAALLDEVALRLSRLIHRLIPMYTLGMDLTEARAIALHDAIHTVRDLRATTQDGEAT